MTLWQPWASLVEIGVKPYETRPKAPPKKLIGQRIAIHAALRKPRPCYDVDAETFDAITKAFKASDYGDDWEEMLPLGAVVATARLVAAYPVEKVQHDLFGDYRPGRFAWLLDQIFPLRVPVPAKGQQLWGWPWTVPEGVRVWKRKVA